MHEKFNPIEWLNTTPKAFDKSEVYEKKVRPLVEQLMKISQEENIPCSVILTTAMGTDSDGDVSMGTVLVGNLPMEETPPIHAQVHLNVMDQTEDIPQRALITLLALLKKKEEQIHDTFCVNCREGETKH